MNEDPADRNSFLKKLRSLLVGGQTSKLPESESNMPSSDLPPLKLFRDLLIGRETLKMPDSEKLPVRQAVSQASAASQKKPKVLFIMPRMPSTFGGMQYSAKVGEFKYYNAPLGIMTLAAVISPEYEVELRDENIDPVEHPTDADIVAITGFLLEAFHVGRMISIAQYFRNRGKVVCMGGPVANLLPEMIRPFCDVVFEGEGELTWPQFLKDYESGDYKDRYEQIEMVDMKSSPVPRIDLITPDNYAVGTIQTTRGCPFTCEFCDIIVMYGRKVRAKAISQVIREVEMWADAGMEIVLFGDDNLIGNRPYVKELLHELIQFQSKRAHPLLFWTQASIDMAKDRELLELMRDAGFFSVFIGIESPRKESLAETLKVQNVHTQDLEEAIHIVQSYGIFVTGGMIVGFDHDDIAIFDEQYDFLQRSGVIMPMMNVLNAPPKTPLYKRMEEAGRLMDPKNDLITNIKPVCMSYDELHDNYMSMVQRIYSYDATLERHLRTIEYMRDCKWPLDKQRCSAKNFRKLFNLLKHYLWTTDSQRRSFFFKLLIGTLKINPYAYKFALRYLALYIHTAKHFSTKTNLMMAPPSAHAFEFKLGELPEEVVTASAAHT